MDLDRFIGLVQNRARLATQSDALTATRATLETLAQRIGRDRAHHLAAQLPREIGLLLEKNAPATPSAFLSTIFAGA
jgi:uncharacterized protein (DUF2267 family)